MPLQKSEIIYNLGIGGVDQKTDPKFAPLGRPAELANVRFPKNGRIAKRYGMVPAVSDTVATTNIQRIIETESGMLAMIKKASGARSVYSLSTATDRDPLNGSLGQIVGGATPPIPMAWVDNVITGSAASNYVDTIDSAAGVSQTCFVYSLEQSQSFYSIVDNKTGNSLVGAVSISLFGAPGGATQLRVFAVPNSNVFAAILRNDGNANALCVVLLSAAAGVIATSSTLTVNANFAWDAAMFGSSLIIAARTNAATTLTVSRFTVSTTALGSPTSSSALTMTVGPVNVAVCVPFSSTEDAVILVDDATNGLRGLTVSTTALTVVQALFTIRATVETKNQLTGIRLASGACMAVYEVANASNHLVSVRESTFAVGSSESLNTKLFNAYLCSKPVLTTGSVAPFYVAGHLSKAGSAYGLQHSRFLVEAGAVVVAMFLNGDASLPPSIGSSFAILSLPSIVAMPDNTSIYGSQVIEYSCPTTRIVKTVVDESGSLPRRILAVQKFNVHPRAGYLSARDGPDVLIQAGYLANFDGSSLMENGFLLYPEIVSVTASNGAGTLPNNGSYSFVAVFSYIDGRGNLHRSAPSEVVTGTTGAADDTFTVVVRCLTMSVKIAYGIELYRTENNGTIFYLSELQVFNVPNLFDVASFTVTGSEATLIASTPLDQQSGILDNAQPNCPVAIAVASNRAMVVPGDDRLSAMSSKERRQREGLSFFDAPGRRIASHGPIAAVESFGNRWMACKKRRIYIASGEGSDDSGQSDNLSEFEAHPTVGIGTAYPRSIVSTPYGLIFKSERGFYLADAGGSISPIGVAIDDYRDFPIAASAYYADRNEAHFLLVDGPKLVLTMFEFEGGVDWRWSIDEINDSADAYSDIAVIDGLMYASAESRNGGDPRSLFVEDIGGYADQGSAYPVVMRFTTGWIPIAGRSQGRGRLYGAKFLGTAFGGPHTARVRAAYDYLDDWIDDKSITSANATAGSDAPYQWEFTPTRQKIQAVRFEFTETLSSASRGCELNQLMLTVGVQPGSKTLRRSQRAVTT